MDFPYGKKAREPTVHYHCGPRWSREDDLCPRLPSWNCQANSLRQRWFDCRATVVEQVGMKLPGANSVKKVDCLFRARGHEKTVLGFYPTCIIICALGNARLA